MPSQKDVIDQAMQESIDEHLRGIFMDAPPLPNKHIVAHYTAYRNTGLRRIVIEAEPCVNLGCFNGQYRGARCRDCDGRGSKWPGWVQHAAVGNLALPLEGETIDALLDALHAAQPKGEDDA